MTHMFVRLHFRKKLSSVQDLRPIVFSMQSFIHTALMRDSGYFHIWISSVKGQPFFQINQDKAYFISFLQEHLSPRQALSEFSSVPHGFAQAIDLLAFSLTDKGVHILLFTSRKQSIEDFGQTILLSYATYIQAQQEMPILPFDSLFIFDTLAGRHEALNVSRDIHLLHEDWRGDRYSSIGFYLDDRRGDWMRPYRVTSLFKNAPRRYVQFLKSQDTQRDRIFEYLET